MLFVLVPGELLPLFWPERDPVELGREWECGWSAWDSDAPLNRALIVLALLVPVDPPTLWECDPIE